MKNIFPLLLLFASVSAHALYLSKAELDQISLPPPPAIDSAQDKEDLATVNAWEKKRSAAECSRASEERVPRIDILFKNHSPFAEPLPKEVNALYASIADDMGNLIHSQKDKYKRLRPFLRDANLKPCAPKESGFAYPSGHSALAHLYALLFSDISPGRRQEFMARADEAGLDRVIGGVHHPSDIAAGALLAKEYHDVLFKKASYQAALKQITKLAIKSK